MADAPEKKPSEVKRQGRSPAYPSISLKKAIEKAKALHTAEGKYAVPLTSAFAAWGYGEKSSGGRETKASLRYFGLISNEDGDKIKLTDDALRIILDEREDETEKKAIIRKLALLPAIHRQLLAKFPDGIVSKATAEHYLIFEEGFNKKAAGDVIAEFKETAEFTGLFKPDMVTDKLPPLDEVDQEDDEDNGGDQNQQHKDPPGRKVKMADGERVIFTEEGQPSQYLKLIASGEVDDVLLEALEDFVKRQRKRLGITKN